LKISNWGLFPWIDAQTVSSKEELINQLKEKSTLIARGMGRCYGDSSLNDLVWSALRYSEIVEFDDQTGRLTCESGVTLEKILSVVVPKGWFLPVTPGTKYVSVVGPWPRIFMVKITINWAGSVGIFFGLSYCWRTGQ